MNFYIPFRPTKGQAFRLYFGALSSDNNPAFPGLNTGIPDIYISKDGQAFANVTNTFVTVSDNPGGYASYANYFYLDLTSEEMDADVVVITFKSPSIQYYGYGHRYIIYTTPKILTDEDLTDVADKVKKKLIKFLY